MCEKLATQGKKTERRDLKGLERGNRDNGGAGGLVGIGGRAKPTLQARVRRRGTFFGQSP